MRWKTLKTTKLWLQELAWVALVPRHKMAIPGNNYHLKEKNKLFDETKNALKEFFNAQLKGGIMKP